MDSADQVRSRSPFDRDCLRISVRLGCGEDASAFTGISPRHRSAARAGPTNKKNVTTFNLRFENRFLASYRRAHVDSAMDAFAITRAAECPAVRAATARRLLTRFHRSLLC